MRTNLTFLIALFFLIPGLTSAQFIARTSNYSPENIKGNESQFFIPFNDHGKWGYCDTLGNIQIKPSLDEAGFFRPYRMGDLAVYYASVATKAGTNLMLSDGDLLLPKKYRMVKPILGLLPKEKDVPVFIVEKKGKHALYHPQEGLLSKFTFDEPNNYVTSRELLCLRDLKTKLYHQFIPEKRSFKPTPYSEFMSTYIREESKWSYKLIGITPEADTFVYHNGTFVPFTLSPPIDELIEEDPPEFEDTSIDGEPYVTLPSKSFLKETALALQVDEVTESQDFGRNNVAKKYGFSKLHVVRKGDKMGVLNEEGRIILPVSYDRVTLEDEGSQARLELDGKVGRKIFFTHYPTIEPRFDQLRPSLSLRVTSRWLFTLFKGVIDGQEVYIGENGVEYFNLN
jgi:hypothetical protein